MLGINYIKSNPTQYIIHYQNGRIKHKGAGTAFLYYKPTASIAVVPVASTDVPFIFNEISSDFQPVTVQGQLTYRIVAPELVASLLDYTIEDSIDNYISDDPDKLDQRLVNLAQELMRAEVQMQPMRSIVRASDVIAKTVVNQLRSSEAVQELGVQVLTFSLLAIKPTPEIARALEAEARETLLKKSDGAVYDRRNAAVEQERRIKENELNTEIAVEGKKRQIRETKIEADLAIEAKHQEIREAKLAGQIRLELERKNLVAAQTENARVEADIQAYAVEVSLRPLNELDDKTLKLLALQSAEPRLMVTQALQQMAENAHKIGQLNISPDLLESLMKR